MTSQDIIFQLVRENQSHDLSRARQQADKPSQLPLPNGRGSDCSLKNLFCFLFMVRIVPEVTSGAILSLPTFKVNSLLYA